jgi:predicted NBD/HSP70 family sugar kinase
MGGLPDAHRLAGVGTAVVGIARRSDGFVHLAPNLGWRDIPLGEMLTAGLDLGVPALVGNDADLGALGEHRRGGRSGVDHLVYVSGEVGIGCGFIVDGDPLLGSAGYAGEAGHNLVDPSGRRCGCGAIGCWETEAGEEAILRRAGSVRNREGLEALDLVEERAVAGDEQTLAGLAESGRWLGLGIRTLINTFNPELVVLGGLYHRFFEFIEDGVRDGAQDAIKASRQMARIARSNIGPDASLAGAAELALAAIIADPAALAAM